MEPKDFTGRGTPGSGNRYINALHGYLLLCCLLNYLAHPPVRIPLLAWVACGLFAWIVAKHPFTSRRDWWIAWVSASMMWLMLLQGIRLAFWPLTAGWIALSLYLAVYFPLSLWIATRLRYRFRFPLSLACAIGWTTCELLRSYVITGFAPCALSHSQTPWPIVLQIASQFGGYGVGFMMMLSTAWLVDLLYRQPKRDQVPEEFNWITGYMHGLVRASIFAWLILSYATWTARREQQQQMAPIKPLGRFVLVQDHMPTMFDATPELIEQGWLDYESTTARAISTIRDQAGQTGKPDQAHVDLIVWPESVYSGLAPTMDWDGSESVPSILQMDQQQLTRVHEKLQRENAFKLRRLRSSLGGDLPNLLVGTDVIKIHQGGMDRYNSALWIDPSQEARHLERPDYYAKRHLVMFGEYIPVLSWFPSLMQRIGLGTLSAGSESKAWELPSGRRVMANVCFEDTVPHLIRSQLNQLAAEGKSPDVLINISNDGWFRGSSILDHHLNSAILAAVENRIPVLVAANTGITAWIDGDGQLIKRLAKMESGWLVAEPIPDGRSGYWSWWGDWPARLIALIGLLSVVESLIAKKWLGKKIKIPLAGG